MTEFERALEACLDKLRNGAGVDSCLRAYPEHAAELRPHLLAAAAIVGAYAGASPRDAFALTARERFLIASGQRLQQAFDVRPSDDFASAARERFIAASGRRLSEAFDVEPSPSFFAVARVKFLMAAHRMRQQGSFARTARPLLSAPMRAAATAAFAIAVFLGFSTYTVASASSALPGDWRYPVKLQTERVRLALAFTEDARHDVQLDIAEERADEVRQLAAHGRIIGPGVLDRLTDQTQPLVDAAANGELDSGELARLRTVTTKQRTVLAEVAPSVAPEALPKLAEAQAVSRQGSIIAAVVKVNTDGGPAVITPDEPFTPPAATETPDPNATPEASVTPEVQPTAIPTRVGLVLDQTPEATANGISWVRLAVGQFTTLMPSAGDGWQIQGISVLDGSQPAPTLVRIANSDGTSLITINPRNGDMYWFIAVGGVFDEIQMRATRDGETFVADRDVITRLYGPLADIPLYVLDHSELLPLPTPSATPTSTAAATPTPTPASP